MWKAVTEKGEKLPDLLVVLAITVVLAAVLLPAVTSSHGNEVNAESGMMMGPVVLDGPVRSTVGRAMSLEERYADTADPDDGTAVEAADEPDSEAEPSLKTGLQQMRTTDISYSIP